MRMDSIRTVVIDAPDEPGFALMACPIASVDKAALRDTRPGRDIALDKADAGKSQHGPVRRQPMPADGAIDRRSTGMRRIFRDPLRVGIVACAGIALLAGCSGHEPAEVVVGSDSPPSGFGEVDASLSGCASVSGLYAWPPIEGVADEGRSPNDDPPRRRVLVPTSLALYPEAQLWIDDHRVFRLSARRVNRDPNLGISTEWGYTELSDVACNDGRWTWQAPDDNLTEWSMRGNIVKARLDDTGAESIAGGLHLQRMADGSLALGQWERMRFRAPGRQGPPAAGESPLDPPARITWHWSLLERTGDTGEGVPPIDARVDAKRSGL